jgi:hypothetical protein
VTAFDRQWHSLDGLDVLLSRHIESLYTNSRDYRTDYLDCL